MGDGYIITLPSAIIALAQKMQEPDGETSPMTKTLTETKYGFNWGNMVVERCFTTEKGHQVLVVKVGQNEVEIISSPKGRNVRVRQSKSIWGGDACVNARTS